MHLVAALQLMRALSFFPLKSGQKTENIYQMFQLFFHNIKMIKMGRYSNTPLLPLFQFCIQFSFFFPRVMMEFCKKECSSSLIPAGLPSHGWAGSAAGGVSFRDIPGSIVRALILADVHPTLRRFHTGRQIKLLSQTP